MRLFTLRMFLVLMGLIVAGVVVFTLQKAYGYYSTPVKERFRSPLHKEYKPGGSIGHPLGIAGSVLMISMLSYSVRKRSKFMRGKGKLNLWLQFHIFCGVAGPILITLHAAFKFRGIVAISYWSMVIVALSGLIGRYLYAQVPRAISGSELQFDEIKNQIDEINEELARHLQPDKLEQVRKFADFHLETRPSALKALFLMISDDIRWVMRRTQLRQALQGVDSLSDSDRERLYHLARKREIQQRRLSLLQVSNNLFRHWHVMHLPLAQTMYLTMVIHIIVAVMTGYF